MQIGTRELTERAERVKCTRDERDQTKPCEKLTFKLYLGHMDVRAAQ